MKGKIWLCVLLFAALASVPFLVPHCGWVALFAFIPLLRLADLAANGQIKHKGWIGMCMLIVAHRPFGLHAAHPQIAGAFFCLG